MSLTTKVLIALAAGLALGVILSASGTDLGGRIIPFIEPVGTLWVNAIRMTVIPLVVGSIIVGVTSAPDTRTIGRIGGRALALFLVLLFAAAGFAALVAPPLLGLIPLEADAVAALRAAGSTATEGAGESIRRIPTFGQWLVDLIPTNPVRAAADGSMLPLIFFSVIFGMAITRVTGDGRGLLIGFFRAIADAALTLVRWILALAPIGVFALAVPLAARLGVSAAGALLGYIAVTAAVCTAFALVVLYPAARVFGRVSFSEFARGVFPAQAVAFSARSSLAALPAMMEASRDRLGLPQQVTTFFLPLAASTFRVGGAVGLTVGVLFIGRLYGVDLSPVEIGSVLLTVVLTTFSVPGIPAGSIIVMVPTLMAAGLPVEGMGILLGADTIPDMFRTTTNVTGDMSAAVILSRGEGEGNGAARTGTPAPS